MGYQLTGTAVKEELSHAKEFPMENPFQFGLKPKHKPAKNGCGPPPPPLFLNTPSPQESSATLTMKPINIVEFHQYSDSRVICEM